MLLVPGLLEPGVERVVDHKAVAELLVVGNRGHSMVVEVILGSVSSYCVHHASCPVVVIREPKVEQEPVPAAAAVPLTPGPLL